MRHIIRTEVEAVEWPSMEQQSVCQWLDTPVRRLHIRITQPSFSIITTTDSTIKALLEQSELAISHHTRTITISKWLQRRQLIKRLISAIRTGTLEPVQATQVSSNNSNNNCFSNSNNNNRNNRIRQPQWPQRRINSTSNITNTSTTSSNSPVWSHPMAATLGIPVQPPSPIQPLPDCPVCHRLARPSLQAAVATKTGPTRPVSINNSNNTSREE